jgi:hypothetical protein
VDYECIKRIGTQIGIMNYLNNDSYINIYSAAYYLLMLNVILH